MKYPYKALCKHSKELIYVLGHHGNGQYYCVYSDNPKDIIILNKNFFDEYYDKKTYFVCLNKQNQVIAQYPYKTLAMARAGKENLTVAKLEIHD